MSNICRAGAPRKIGDLKSLARSRTQLPQHCWRLREVASADHRSSRSPLVIPRVRLHSLRDSILLALETGASQSHSKSVLANCDMAFQALHSVRGCSAGRRSCEPAAATSIHIYASTHHDHTYACTPERDQAQRPLRGRSTGKRGAQHIASAGREEYEGSSWHLLK